MRRLSFSIACALVLFPRAALARAPYEDFRAADLARGERLSLGEISLGLYSHYQQFSELFEDGKSFDGASEIHFVRWVPVLFADYQPLPQLRGTMIVHGGIIDTDLHEAGTGRRLKGSIAGLADILLIAQWSPWLGDIPADHEHTFFDLHNLSFVAAPKIDLSNQDDEVGLVPGAAFRRTSSGAHEIDTGIVYTGHVNDASWIYLFVQGAYPFSRNNFGLRPGLRLAEKIGFSWLPNEALQLFFEAEHSFQARADGGRIPAAVENSGGNLVTVTPGMTVDIAAGFGIELSLTLPVLSKLRGTQPEADFDLFFGLYKSFAD
jgi:hypothetical protein